MNEIMTLVSTVGFPIAMCLLLAWYIHSQTESYREDVHELTDKYNESLKDFKKALDENTKTLTALSAKLGGENASQL